MIKLFRRREQAIDIPEGCPILAAVDWIKGRGWTVAAPFPIPGACLKQTCGHAATDPWAVDYARRAKQLTRDVEDGQLTPRGEKAMFELMFRELDRKGLASL